MILFGRSFSAENISFVSDKETIATTYADSIEFVTGKRPQTELKKSGKYLVSIKNKRDRIDILNEFGYLGNELNFQIKASNLENKDCCVKSFLRGCFISCGTVTDPKKEYHLDFSIGKKSRCVELIPYFEEISIYPKLIQRNGNFILYIKDSAQIEDFLTIIGDSNAALYIMGEKIEKNVRNYVNRQVNCESANIQRVCDASVAQIEAINLILEKRGFDFLPEHLRQLAELRLENPEMSLSELGAELTPAITRSGVNHRMKKLMEISKSLE